MLGLLLLILTLWLAAAVVAAIVRWRPQPPRPLAPPARPPRRPVRADVPHALYDYMHAERPGRIYVGISNEPEARHRRHGRDPKDQWWYRRSTKTMHLVAWYPNRAAAEDAEELRVRSLAHAGDDLANTHHNPYARRTRRAA